MKFVYTSGSRPLDGYTIKRGVGIGGFGEVYFATSDAGKEVALKRVQRNLDVEVRGVTQCLNLKHPNLIAIYDIKYDDQGEGWIVMEYVAGESLRDLIDHHPDGIPREELTRWFEEVASGVAYLHDHGIVHRDLKPGNIFCDEDVIKIGDYGLSKFISCSRRSGQTESVGTFHYMAPEIGKGVYGKEIDIYALGIILYEMLTGRVPFEGESSQEIIMKHLTANPDLSGIEAPFRRVIEKCLFKDPAKRYSNVSEMMRALKMADSPSRPSTRSFDVPPVVVKESVAAKNETLYIGDNVDEDITFGPVVEVVKPVAEKPPVTVPPPNSEPIAQAVKSSWRDLTAWWNNANFSAPLKLLLLVGGIFVLIFNAQWLVPLGIVLLAVYLVYFGVRSVVLALSDNKPVATANQAPSGARSDSNTVRRRRRNVQPVTRTKWQLAARKSLGNRTASEQLTELTGSLIMAAMASAVMCLVMLVLAGLTFDGSVGTWSFYAWMTLSSTFGAWMLLGLGKCWECSEGEHVRRRFVLLIAGLALGTLAYGLSTALMVPIKHDANLTMSVGHIPDSWYTGGTPQLPAYLAYFAGLFVILRWWKQADPLRKTRLSLWATGMCVLWAWVMHAIWHFPQPWGFMLAVTISVAVQLSAPWMSSQDRTRIRGAALEAS